MQKFAHGAFMWTGTERRNKRYGFVYPSDTDANDTVIATPTLDKSVLDAMIGKRVKIVCHVIETRTSTHLGDRFLGIVPSTPQIGDMIVLGVGRLVVSREGFSKSGYSFGVQPSDNRQELWLDPRVVYRLHEQTVDFLIEETQEPDSPETDLSYGDTSGAISNGDGSFQILGEMDSPKQLLAKPVIEPIGDGMFMVHTGEFPVGKRFQIKKR